ncbi:hypothetical protein DDZ13_15105 [Coraliomargarita sinensis]|uniref:Uncharacterized protein n=1 Tax=Coraliomargarita sinensis TaxID=2174842 RepID=A0A317ZCH5_9BACT|nr:hypothetical protein [Coraliomargarita sinensis]PXA02834.1 hypothetical protein DDZ13_15105 [Coraliomargarita sinensis]
MNEDLKKRIIKELEKRDATKPCARCGNNSFTILEEFSRVEQQTDFQNLRLGGPSVPCVVVGCNNCGNMNLHAIGILGFMDEISAKEDKKKEGENNE